MIALKAQKSPRLWHLNEATCNFILSKGTINENFNYH